MAAFNFVEELVGSSHAHSLRVVLARPEPADLSPYQSAFGSRLRFNAEQTAVVLSSEIIELPISGTDPKTRKAVEERLQSTFHVGELETLTRLRWALRIAILNHEASAIGISAQMGLGRRTLQRRLDEFGLSFQQLLDESRCEFAQQLLSNTNLSIAEIGTIVDFSDPSVLTRSFTRWAGQTPSEWRAKAR